MKLDLGCGSTPADGHVGVDLPDDTGELPPLGKPFQATVDPHGIIRFDLCSGVPWPFLDESIDALHSSHLIEHLPAGRILTHEWTAANLGGPSLKCTGTQDALFWFLDEAWRVTKAGGTFLLRWPALVDPRTKTLQMAAFQDPTHYRFIPLEQIQYWRREGREALGVSSYRARCNWLPKEARQRELGSGPHSLVENEILFEKAP